jgi:hypothetical protein
VRPVVTVQVVAEAVSAVQMPPEGDELTEYPMMAEPPMATGSVQATTTVLPETVAVTEVGAAAAVTAVTALDWAEAGEFPRALVATAVKRYAVPAVRPPTVHEVAGAAMLQVPVPGDVCTE